jgi:hypothetical protein
MELNGVTTSDFVTEAAGPQGLFGVFEDDGETGYLYLYEPGGREVFQHLHIYDRTPNLLVQSRMSGSSSSSREISPKLASWSGATCVELSIWVQARTDVSGLRAATLPASAMRNS